MPMLPLPPLAKSLEGPSPLPLTLPSKNPPHCCCNCNAPPKVSVFLSPDEVDVKGGSERSSCRECQARQIVTTGSAARTLQKHVAELENEMKEKHENKVGPNHSSQKVNSDHDCEAPVIGAERTLATAPSSGRASVEEDQPPIPKLSPLGTPREELSPPSPTSTIRMPLLSSPPCLCCVVHPEVSLHPIASSNYVEEGGENSSFHQCQARHILLLKKASWTLEKRATKMINKKKEGDEADKLATKWREWNPLSLQETESETAEEQQSMSVGVNGVIVIHRNNGEEEEKEDEQQPLPSSAGKSQIHKAVKHRMRLMAKAARYHGSIIANANRHRYSLGQLARLSMMDVPSSEEDALAKATLLREGDGAWVKRRRRRSSTKSKGDSNNNSWTFAMVKERHEAHIIFTVNKRGSMKIFPMSSWAEFIRIVAQEDFNPTGDVHAANDILKEDEVEIHHEDETDIMERTQALIESHPVMKRIMDMSRLEEGAEQQHLNNEGNPSSNVPTESILGGGSVKNIKEEGKQQITAIQDHEVSMYTLGEESSTLKGLQDHELTMHTLSDEDAALPTSISFHDTATMAKKKKKRKQKTARRSKSLPSMPPVLISSFVSLPMYCTDFDAGDEETNSMLNESALTLKHSNSRSHANNCSTLSRTK